MALKNIGICHESVGISEIDKYAIMAYNAIHGETKNFGDIRSIDWNEVPNFDLFTYSFPCQSISVSGKMRGFQKGSSTKSSLLWSCEHVIELKKPRFLLMENVKTILSKKFNSDFSAWQVFLSNLGYNNFIFVLNAKDYGVPQSRERAFMISLLDGWYITPEKIPLSKNILSILEKNVDKKYFLEFPDFIPDLSKQLLPNNKIKNLGMVELNTLEQNRRIYDVSGIAPTIDTAEGGNRKRKIFINGKIREMTPREYLRLMDVNEEDCDKIFATGMSNMQIYKIAGNSIPVGLLENIFKQLPW